MKKWWVRTQKELLWDVSDDEKGFLERLTGRLPIFLAALKRSAKTLLAAQGSPQTVPSPTISSNPQANTAPQVSPSSSQKTAAATTSGTTPPTQPTGTVSTATTHSTSIPAPTNGACTVDVRELREELIKCREVAILENNIGEFANAQLLRLDNKDEKKR
jgi:hypothetical protein